MTYQQMKKVKKELVATTIELEVIYQKIGAGVDVEMNTHLREYFKGRREGILATVASYNPGHAAYLEKLSRFVRHRVKVLWETKVSILGRSIPDNVY